jgi:hypothetical protein
VARKLYGERLYDRYIKHPASSSTNPLSDGWAVDAGSAMLLSHNIHHLLSQSQRSLVCSPGDGRAFSAWTSKDDLWNVATEKPGDTASSTGPASIPWDGLTARRFGPVPMLFDRLASQQRLARKVRCRVQFEFNTIPATTRVVHFAMTTGSGSRLPRATPAAYASVTATNATGVQTQTADLTVYSPLTESLVEPWPSRGAGSVEYGPMLCYVVPMYVWFGFEFVGTALSTPNWEIYAMSAWELGPG